MPRPAGTKRKPGRPRDQTIYYVIEIADWDWSLMFGASNARHIDRGPYSDYRHLHVEGTLLRPHNPKITNVRLTFIPRQQLDSEADRAKDEPVAIGQLSSHRGTLEGILSMPLNGLTPVLQMLIAERFRYVVLNGDKQRYGQADVRTFRFERTVSEDDLPLEE